MEECAIHEDALSSVLEVHGILISVVRLRVFVRHILLEDAPLPFIMQHAAKISSVRKRVSSLNSLLKSIQGRIDNIDRMISFGTAHEELLNPHTLAMRELESITLAGIFQINHGVIVILSYRVDHKHHGCSGLIRKVVSIHCMLKSASRATEDFDNPLSDDIYSSLS
ncbi:hypothetical protein V8G54_026317 [Vigna mungo]|uniref:Biogenesis of lysosome-related organelles complex 1 subunit 7 n=1 Tax=Vigna mungo TaxID=3915 RepID=A0AAQ3MZD8_VIGMU